MYTTAMQVPTLEFL